MFRSEVPCSHLSSLLFDAHRLFQIDFRSDCHFYSASSTRPSATKERLVCASRAEGRKAAGTPLSFSFSLSFVAALGWSVDRSGSLFQGNTGFPGWIIDPACVCACGFSSRVCARVYERHAESLGYSSLLLEVLWGDREKCTDANPTVRPSDKLAIHHYGEREKQRERGGGGREKEKGESPSKGRPMLVRTRIVFFLMHRVKCRMVSDYTSYYKMPFYSRFLRIIWSYKKKLRFTKFNDTICW